jgi:hypothetical protein
MTNRREFLEMGVAASALPWAASAAALGPTEALASVPLYKVLYDTRFTASVEFARRATTQGLAVHAMDGDMTRFWYDDLYYRWRQGPAAIAGLTAHGALFCLEQLAWDQRMRVVFRAEHSVADAGCVAHRFEGPAALLPAAAEATASPAWAAAMADVVTQCPRGRVEHETASAVTTRAVTSPSTEPLFSWVIAPVIRA